VNAEGLAKAVGELPGRSASLATFECRSVEAWPRTYDAFGASTSSSTTRGRAWKSAWETTLVE
jgi:hypothetical protein